MGEKWLKQSLREKQLFVSGYMLGYVEATEDSCSRATKDWPGQSGTRYEAERNDKCTREGTLFANPSDKLVASITDFYKRYPEDRDLYPDEVLKQLGLGLTLEQIHNHPFMAHAPPHPRSN